LAENHAAVWFP